MQARFRSPRATSKAIQTWLIGIVQHGRRESERGLGTSLKQPQLIESWVQTSKPHCLHSGFLVAPAGGTCLELAEAAPGAGGLRRQATSGSSACGACIAMWTVGCCADVCHPCAHLGTRVAAASMSLGLKPCFGSCDWQRHISPYIYNCVGLGIRVWGMWYVGWPESTSGHWLVHNVL